MTELQHVGNANYPELYVDDKPELSFDDIVRKLENELLMSDGPPSIDGLVSGLDAVERKLRKGGLRETGNREALIENRYTRLATVIARVAAHPEVTITHNQLVDICRRKQQITYIFNASGYRNMKHLVELAAEASEEANQYRLKAVKAAVLLAFMGLEDVSDDQMQRALAQPPRVLLTLMLGWLNQRAILTEQGERNRTLLLQSGELIRDVEINDKEIPYIVNAYMYCTYACTPNKNEFKKHLNHLLKQRMTAAGLKVKPTQRVTVERPKMVVIHERFHHHHAMYRCYAPYIEALKGRFQLISVSEEEMITDQSAALFDQSIKWPPDKPSITKMAAVIQKLQPDIIYYPSLGMSHWTVMLSNLRLAPIQFMTLGHPATSQSTEIDYVFLPEIGDDPSGIFSERVLTGASVTMFAPHSELPEDLPPLPEPSNREVRIGINSKVMKLSYRLLNICARLDKESPIPITFIFFPGERFLFFDGLVAAIRARLPTAKVLPYIDYPRFISELSKCDLTLAAFPFGNTNSTVDTCLMGLPTVAHYGPEPSEQGDYSVLDMAGFDELLVTDTDEAYFAKAMSLIEDVAERKNVARGKSRNEIRQRLFEVEAKGANKIFSDVIWHVYLHHEAMIESGKRVFRYHQLLADSHD